MNRRSLALLALCLPILLLLVGCPKTEPPTPSTAGPLPSTSAATPSSPDAGETIEIAMIPKLVGIFVALVVAGPWMLSVMLDYMRQVFTGIPNLVG